MAVWSTDVGPNADKEIHHVVVAPADCIVKGSDALIVRLAGVAHLQELFENIVSQHIEIISGCSYTSFYMSNKCGASFLVCCKWLYTFSRHRNVQLLKCKQKLWVTFRFRGNGDVLSKGFLPLERNP